MLRLPAPPALPRPPARVPFPIIAVVAPVIGAVVIGVVTQSAFVLVFAVLSPLIAIATVLDGRRTARRERRAEADRFTQECASYEAAIARAHAAERAEAEVRHPQLPIDVAIDERVPVRLGSAPAPSAVAPEEMLFTGDSLEAGRLRELLARAREHQGLPVVVARGPIAVRGDGAAAEALVRRLKLEPGVVVERLGDRDSGRPSGADPSGSEPSGTEPSGTRSSGAAPTAVVVRVLSATCLEVTEPGGARRRVRPEFASRRQLAEVQAHRSNAGATTPPTEVTWQGLRGAAVPGGDRGARQPGVPIGMDADGVVALDLEHDGPHALIGGTTGSGKSEFLRSLALGWAADRPPHELQLLFVDFKGGATFAGLTDLPHTIGLVTDLDPLVAERALLSLRAELRRRERVLVDAGLRDLTQQPGVLARLVVLVDEFAALIDAFPELHAPFADLSARGRSLGVHLVLCTQNPASVVRDSVAANCAVRVAFRLTNAAGTGFVGSDGRDLATVPPGRALIVSAQGARSVQIATIDDADVAEVCRRWVGSESGPSPWLPPLPARLERSAVDGLVHDVAGENGEVLATASTGLVGDRGGEAPSIALVFGLLDDPAEQRRLRAVWHPARDGSLAVLGSARSGRTTALSALVLAAAELGLPTAVLPPTLPEAWALLEGLIEHPPFRGLLIADDLDLLVAEAGDLADGLLALWDAAVRAVRRGGGCAAAVVGTASASRSVIGARFGSRLLLRCADADDHQLAGAPRGLFDRAAPAGRGWWADRQVQVIATPGALTPTPCPAAQFVVPEARDVVVVTRRPEAVLTALYRTHPDRRVVHEIAGEPPPHQLTGVVDVVPRIFVGDPEAWQASWALFSAMRRTSVVVLAHADPADARALLAQRNALPPLDIARGEVWVGEPGEPLRRRRWAGLETT